MLSQSCIILILPFYICSLPIKTNNNKTIVLSPSCTGRGPVQSPVKCRNGGHTHQPLLSGRAEGAAIYPAQLVRAIILGAEEQRRQEGRPEQPAAVVVSRSPDFPLDWLFFRQPLQRWLLSDGADQPGFKARVQSASTWCLTLQRLAEQGFSRVVLLGGAGLTASMLEEDCIDELQFTLTPRLLGGAYCWLPASQPFNPLPPALPSSQGWTLEEALPLGGDELLVRYRRRR